MVRIQMMQQLYQLRYKNAAVVIKRCASLRFAFNDQLKDCMATTTVLVVVGSADVAVALAFFDTVQDFLRCFDNFLP